MSPGHVAPLVFKGIMLKEEVVFALVIDQAVGVVNPVLSRGKVKLRPVFFVVKGPGS